MGTIVTRIKEYLEFKGISNAAFEKSMGLSNAAFRNLLLKGGAIGSDKLENFITLYPEVSLLWLVKGEGAMLTDNQPENPVTEEPSGLNGKDEVVKILREMLAEERSRNDALQERINELIEENARLKTLIESERKGGVA